MDLRHLRYFLCVAEEMHFGRAASRLGISQPPLSQQIRALEEELGVRLFDRTSRRVRLTHAGRLFEPEARRTLEQANRAMDTARRALRGEIGRLALGITPSAPFVPKIASALYRFRQGYPDVELTLAECSWNEQIDAIRQDRMDIGIVRGFDRSLIPPDFIVDCLIEENLVLVLREEHALAGRRDDPCIADLRGEPLVLYGAAAGAGFNEHLIAQCDAAGFQPDIVHEASGLATLLGLTAAGFGSTVIAQSLARLHVENLVYRPFSPPVMSRLWAVHKGDLSPGGARFMEIVHAADPAV